MPAKSQAQRGFLASNFGIGWMRKHHFDNKGKLPYRVKKQDGGLADEIDKGYEPPNLSDLYKSTGGDFMSEAQLRRAVEMMVEDRNKTPEELERQRREKAKADQQRRAELMNEQPMATGGVAKLRPGVKPLPRAQYGKDIIPAALTPDEMVLTTKHQKAVMPIPGKEKMLKPEQLKRFAQINPRWRNIARKRFQGGGMGERDIIHAPVAPPIGAGWARNAMTRDFYDQFGDPRNAMWAQRIGWGSTFGFNPWTSGGPSMFGPGSYNPPPNTPGATQGPTQVPTYFDSQGYPYATPNTSDIPQGGYGHSHTPPKQKS